MFVSYPKIKRLGDEENDGILFGTCHIEEKIDGANTSIWLEDGEIKCGSRTRELTEGFNGFVDYAKNHPGIKKLLTEYPEYRLFGEWLVRHTVAYKESVYKQFYLFDVALQGIFLNRTVVQLIGEGYGILRPHVFAVLENPLPTAIEAFVGQTVLGNKGEGVVIKNSEFTNKFGDKVYAKMVTQEFKEDNALVFGGNNKHSDTYAEMYCVNTFMTLERVQKVMNKLQPEIDRRLAREHTARIIQTAYHDMFMEEIWGIAKKFETINFKHLARLASRKAAKIYHDILDGHVSVAYKRDLEDESKRVEETKAL